MTGEGAAGVRRGEKVRERGAREEGKGEEVNGNRKKIEGKWK